MPKVKGQKSSKVMLSKKEAKAVRGLIQGDTKQSIMSSHIAVANLTRDINMTVNDDAGISLAPSTVGKIFTSSDSALIKFVEIRGKYFVSALATTSGGLPALINHSVRRLIVWFYKPIDPATAGGSMPLITEVLETNAITSQYVSSTANAGRFVVLSDKTYVLGTNVYIAAANTMKENGKIQVNFEEKVIVNKSQHYVEPPGSAVAPGGAGHYSTNSDEGQVSRGLLVMYHVVEGDAGTLGSDVCYRVTYVA